MIGVTSSLINSIAPNTLSLTNAFLTTGEQRSAALNYITVGNAPFGSNYTISGSHQALIKSARITLVPGFFIQPGAGGLVNFAPSACP